MTGEFSLRFHATSQGRPSLSGGSRAEGSLPSMVPPTQDIYFCMYFTSRDALEKGGKGEGHLLLLHLSAFRHYDQTPEVNLQEERLREAHGFRGLAPFWLSPVASNFSVVTYASWCKHVE